MKFDSQANTGTVTILFIHSLFSAAWEWSPTINELGDSISFRVVTPSLEPDDFFSDLDKCVSTLAQHIKEQSKEGQAHIVGLSIGVRIALHLANSYPEVVRTLFLSGYNTFSPLLRLIAPLVIYFVRKRQHRRTGVSLFSLAQSRAMFRIVSSPPQVDRISARTLIFAGLLQDSKKDAVSLKNAITGAQRIEAIGSWYVGHLWNRDHGEKFGRLLVDWINGDKQCIDDLDGSFFVVL
jgi:pimeloyl-ACP methyl ester carboxylesterase